MLFFFPHRDWPGPTWSCCRNWNPPCRSPVGSAEKRHGSARLQLVSCKAILKAFEGLEYESFIQPGFYPFELGFFRYGRPDIPVRKLDKLVRIVSSRSFLSTDNANCRNNRINEPGWLGWVSHALTQWSCIVIPFICERWMWWILHWYLRSPYSNEVE